MLYFIVCFRMNVSQGTKTFDRFAMDTVIGILEGTETFGKKREREIKEEIKKHIIGYFDDVEHRESQLNTSIEDVIEGLVMGYGVSIHDPTQYEKIREGIATRFNAIEDSRIQNVSHRTKGLVGRIEKIFSFYMGKEDSDPSGFRLIVQHKNTPSINFVNVWKQKDKQGLIRFLEQYKDEVEIGLNFQKMEFEEVFNLVINLYQQKFERQNELFQSEIMQKLEDTLDMLKTSSYPLVYNREGYIHRLSAKRQKLSKIGMQNEAVLVDMVRFGVYEGDVIRTSHSQKMDIKIAQSFMKDLKNKYPTFNLGMRVKPDYFETKGSSTNEVHIFKNEEEELCIALRREEFIAIYTNPDPGEYGPKQFVKDVKQISQKMFGDSYFGEPKVTGGIVSKFREIPGQRGHLASDHDIGFLNFIGGWEVNNEEKIGRLLELNGAEDDPRPSILHSKIKNYVMFPKSNSYTGLQGIAIIDGKKVEVQIRTPLQHWIDEEGPAKKTGYDKERAGDFEKGFSEWCENHKPERGKVSKRRINDVMGFRNLVSDEIKKQYVERIKNLFRSLESFLYNGKERSAGETLDKLSDYNERVKADFPTMDLSKIVGDRFKGAFIKYMKSKGYYVEGSVVLLQGMAKRLDEIGIEVQNNIEEQAKQLYLTKIVEDMEELSKPRETDADRITALSMFNYLSGLEDVESQLNRRISRIGEERFKPLRETHKQYRNITVPGGVSVTRFKEWKRKPRKIELIGEAREVMLRMGMDVGLMNELIPLIETYLG